MKWIVRVEEEDMESGVSLRLLTTVLSASGMSGLEEQESG